MRQRRLDIPVAFDREVASIAIRVDGKVVLCVDLDGSDPVGWGIMLADLVREVAAAMELSGLSAGDRLLSAGEIEKVLRNVLFAELGKPTSPIEQAGGGSPN